MAGDAQCYLLSTRGADRARELVFVSEHVDGLGLVSYRLARGKPVGADYPANATTRLEPEHPGVKLSDLVGNDLRCLLASPALKDALLAHRLGEVEVFPFALLNHKGRVHADPLYYVNPLGTVDCVDLDRSRIEWLDGKGSEIVGVDEFVLDPTRLPPRDLFRVPQDTEKYFVSAALKSALERRGFTNLVFTPVAVGERGR